MRASAASSGVANVFGPAVGLAVCAKAWFNVHSATVPKRASRIFGTAAFSNFISFTWSWILYRRRPPPPPPRERPPPPPPPREELMLDAPRWLLARAELILEPPAPPKEPEPLEPAPLEVCRLP